MRVIHFKTLCFQQSFIIQDLLLPSTLTKNSVFWAKFISIIPLLLSLMSSVQLSLQQYYTYSYYNYYNFYYNTYNSAQFPLLQSSIWWSIIVSKISWYARKIFSLAKKVSVNYPCSPPPYQCCLKQSIDASAARCSSLISSYWNNNIKKEGGGRTVGFWATVPTFFTMIVDISIYCWDGADQLRDCLTSCSSTYQWCILQGGDMREHVLPRMNVTPLCPPSIEVRQSKSF